MTFVLVDSAARNLQSAPGSEGANPSRNSSYRGTALIKNAHNPGTTTVP